MMNINAPGIPGQQLKRKSEVKITFVPLEKIHSAAPTPEDVSSRTS